MGKREVSVGATWAIVPRAGPVQVQLALGGVMHRGAAVAFRVPEVVRLRQVLPPAAAVEGDLQGHEAVRMVS